MHRKAKILVVDDDKDTRELIYKILTGEGYDVTTAATGGEALAYLSTDSFEVLITDLRMPEADGLAVLKSVRSLSPSCHPILISAYTDLPVYLEAFKEGAFDVLRKPFSTIELLESLQRARTGS